MRHQARKAFQELQAAVEDLAAGCNDEEALDVNLSAKILEDKSLSRGESFFLKLLNAFLFVFFFKTVAFGVSVQRHNCHWFVK